MHAYKTCSLILGYCYHDLPPSCSRLRLCAYVLLRCKYLNKNTGLETVSTEKVVVEEATVQWVSPFHRLLCSVLFLPFALVNLFLWKAFRMSVVQKTEYGKSHTDTDTDTHTSNTNSTACQRKMCEHGRRLVYIHMGFPWLSCRPTKKLCFLDREVRKGYRLPWFVERGNLCFIKIK